MRSEEPEVCAWWGTVRTVALVLIRRAVIEEFELRMI